MKSDGLQFSGLLTTKVNWKWPGLAGVSQTPKDFFFSGPKANFKIQSLSSHGEVLTRKPVQIPCQIKTFLVRFQNERKLNLFW